ncbi:gp62 [Rhodococcus phage ReqiPine5]|uniref:Gp62 n=1 Tax=Rhodococcus phage ReqiPine5 TaxID=691963 RepID=D4P837_9CAUD|nr:gp62 [Rhodococcus phage ReqiPine5]ADD81167.1 gp62 [Rhodococcus phage ReqiPine5]
MTNDDDLKAKIGKAAINGWIAALTPPNTANSFRDGHIAAGRDVVALDGVHVFEVPKANGSEYGQHRWTTKSKDQIVERVAAVDHDGDVILSMTGYSGHYLTPTEAIALGERLIAAGLRGIEVEKEREDEDDASP